MTAIGIGIRPTFLTLAPAAVADTISGTAYPGETLTASGGAGSRDWQVDGVSTGQTGATYTVTIYDIGKPIKCVTGGLDSNVLTCWHPSDIAAVKSCRVPWLGVLNSVSPDVAATVGQTVRRWNDIVNTWAADQTTGASQPILRQDANGMYYIEGDGSDDLLTRSSTSERAIFNNVAFGGIITAGLLRSFPDTGSSNCDFFSRNGGVSQSRVSIGGTSDGAYQSGARRLDTDDVSTASSSVTLDYAVIESRQLFSSNTNALVVNGSQAATAAYSSGGGSTSATNSDAAHLFARAASAGNAAFDNYCSIVWSSDSGDLSATEYSQLRRFAMLCMGANYTGPDIPLV